MKTIKNKFLKSTYTLAILLVVVIGCDREISNEAVLTTFSNNPAVFLDGFSSGLQYYPFGGSKLEAFSVDTQTKYQGTSSMRFDVPNVGDPTGAYAGAIFRDDNGGRNLTKYDALTFWIKATKSATINEIGFGQDFGENKYQASLQNLRVSTGWTKFTIPIPDPSKLIKESGLFWYAEGPENGDGYTFWVDELQFEKLGTLAQPRPKILNGVDKVEQTFIGSKVVVNGLTQTFNLENGLNQTVVTAPGYFEFTSSNPSVASVDDLGNVTITGTGTTKITATLNGIEAKGSYTLESLGDFTPAPTPTQSASNVLSIFSDAFVNQPVEYYNGYWAPFQTTQGQDDININGDNIIKYSQLNFVGIQFTQPTINISDMSHFHIDIQVKDQMQSSDYLIVRLFDIGSDNSFGGSDDSSAELRLTPTTLSTGNWVGYDIALRNLTTLRGKNNLAQIVFVSDATITDILVDNIYFYKVPTAPTVAAPIPTKPAADVISVFSDAYTNIAGSDFNPNWGQATVASQVPIAGNNTLKYAGLNYQGLQLGSSQNVSGMTHIHIDYYSANSTSLNLSLISSGPVEKLKALTVPTSAGWSSIDIPLSNFLPVNLSDVIQLKFDGNGDIYLDNIYFFK